MSEEKTTVNWEMEYKIAIKRIIELEKENADLHMIEQAQNDYQDKLHDEIDNLRQIIALLVKVNL